MPSTPRKGQRNETNDEPDDQVHISFSIPASVAAQSDISFTFSHRSGRVLRTGDNLCDDGLSDKIVPKLLKFDNGDDSSAIPASNNVALTRPMHRSNNTFGQQEFALVAPALIDLDEACAPDPVYPRKQGVAHPMDPLPERPIAPMKYYIVWRGLKIGVFYDVWSVFAAVFLLSSILIVPRSEIEPISKLVKGGAWRKADTFTEAVAIWKAKAKERKVVINECR